MKKRSKASLALLASAGVAVCAAVLIAATLPRNEPDKKVETERAESAPLIINTETEHLGKVTISQDGEVVFEYDGPMDVRRRDGKYLIEVHTNACSCFREESSGVDE